ncbi:MAG: SPOR domain-containing protein, partial [Deltaproteobacteria bacterium]|nr:SPOR domain-containing protein [Deltaproteobacteria bacterium]
PGTTELKKETAPPATSAKIAQKPGPALEKKAATPAPAPARTSQPPAKTAAAVQKDVKAPAKSAPAPVKSMDVKPVAKQAPPPAKQKTVAAKPTPVKAATVTAKKESAKISDKDSRASLTDRKKLTAASKRTAMPAAVKGQLPVTTSKDVAAKHNKVRAGAEEKAPDKNAGNYTLVVGSYVLKSSMLSDKTKLERAGLKPLVSEGKKKSEPMNRLLVAEFGSYSSARSELSRVKKTSKDAFLLQEKGRFTVYAGSYFNHERAMQEQDRLRKQGFVPIVKKSSAPVSTYTLSSGSYATREAAVKEAGRLRKLGFTPWPSSLKQQ